jgi:hypothetical protein
MKDKIFNALKQAYSSLGLGDALLQAQAETLASLGFVTDENLDAVVKAQETGLRAVQTSNDKRVADALSKASANNAKDKENLTKTAAETQAELQKQIDELKQQQELSKSELLKQQQELKEKQALQAQLEELQKKAEQQSADFEKRKNDLLAFITGKAPETETKTEPKSEKKTEDKPQPPQQNAFNVEAFRKSLIDDFNKQMKSYTDANAQQTAEILATNKSLAEQVQALVKENVDYKAAQAAENRRNFILGKAEELQIPKWRISEGFNIPDNADEAAIINMLTTVSNNIRANMLPQDGVSVPNLGGGNSTEVKAQMDKIAEALVQNL